MTDQPKPRGRPSGNTEAITAEIIARLSAGEPLAAICRDEHMPAVRTVNDWMVDQAFSASIAQARAHGFDAIAAECLEIADDGSQDYGRRTRPDGSEYEAFDAEHVQRSKLRVETRLKLLAKWDPKRYGDRAVLEHTGKDGGPVQLEGVVGVIEKLTDAERVALRQMAERLGLPATESEA